MHAQWCGPDDDALLRELARLLRCRSTAGTQLSEQDVVAAGRAAFAWRGLLAELRLLGTGGAAAGSEDRCCPSGPGPRRPHHGGPERR